MAHFSTNRRGSGWTVVWAAAIVLVVAGSGFAVWHFTGNSGAIAYLCSRAGTSSPFTSIKSASASNRFVDPSDETLDGRWQLRGDAGAGALFTGAGCGLCSGTPWVVQRRATSERPGEATGAAAGTRFK